jgi:uncharacterized damage-inducible protein DinB
MNTTDLFVKIALDGWQAQINATNKLLEKLSDEDLMKEISPARNRGVYLLGHLASIHDMMLPLLRFEDLAFPQLKPIFVDAPDRTVEAIPSAKPLREIWNQVNEKLAKHFEKLSGDEWLTRHNSISEADFVNQPYRNRLSLLLSRTGHLSYHRGQMALLEKKK